jgi:hypothetical protein
MKKLLALAVVMALMGCASSGRRDVLHGDRDALWVMALDAVSDYMTVTSASKSDGTIGGTVVIDNTRSLATVKLAEKAGGYEPQVSVEKQALTQYFTSTKKKSLETWDRVGHNKSLKRRILKGMARRTEKPAELTSASFQGETYEAVFDASQKGLSKHFFRTECVLPQEGLISTERSMRKSGDETSQVRALVLVTKGGAAPSARVKVTAERFRKAWTLWGLGLNLEPRVDCLGRDQRLEREILDGIQQALAAAKQPPAASGK